MQRARNIFKRGGPLTTDNIKEELNISAAHARNIVSRLAKEGLIEDTGTRVEEPASKSNKKTKLWRLCER